MSHLQDVSSKPAAVSSLAGYRNLVGIILPNRKVLDY